MPNKLLKKLINIFKIKVFLLIYAVNFPQLSQTLYKKKLLPFFMLLKLSFLYHQKNILFGSVCAWLLWSMDCISTSLKSLNLGQIQAGSPHVPFDYFCYTRSFFFALFTLNTLSNSSNLSKLSNLNNLRPLVNLLYFV